MIKKIILALCILTLNAQQKEPPPLPEDNPIVDKVNTTERESFWRYHHLASLGYRRDRQRFNQVDTSSAYTGRNSMQLIIGSHIEWHEAVLHIRASYGWLINGNFEFSSPGSTYTEPLSFPKFELGAGYSADVLGTLGWRFKLIDRPNFAMSLIPSGGYKYSHLMNFAEGEKRYTIPTPPKLLSAGTSGFALNSVPNPNQQDWFGPCIDVSLGFRIMKNLQWDFFYQYHWVEVRSKSKENGALYLFDPPSTATAIELYRSNSMYKAAGMCKQLAGTNCVYRVPSGWLVGVHFEGCSAWTHKARYLSKRTLEQYILAPAGVTTTRVNKLASIHWVSYEASFALGYQF